MNREYLSILLKSTFSLFKTISKVKELFIIENGYHEIYNDCEREEYFNKILEWCQKTKTIGKTDKRIFI